MLKLFLKNNGAVSIFLTIILVPVLVVCCLFVDASRAKLASSVVSSAGDLTLNTALTQYDAMLNDYYGLMASSQNVDEFLATANDYFTACITSQGVDASEARKWADKISGLLTGESSDISDLLQITESEGETFQISAAENGTLENPALMKKEIVEFMKYRAPVEGVSDLLQKFRDSSKDLENASKNADLVEKKQDFYEAENALMENAKEAYLKLIAYANLQISADSINQMKEQLYGLENQYKQLHIKMVKDLYNTQGLSQYTAVDLYVDYVAPENTVNKIQVNGYINNVADSMDKFIKAAKQLDNTYGQLPKYNTSNVYDIQYWVACDELLRQNNSYSKYVSEAQTLCKNMASLQTVMGLLTDEEKVESYTLKNYQNVTAAGTGTRQELYDGLNTQYESLKATYFTNKKSAYNQLSGNLARISSANIENIKTDSTDQKIREIKTALDGYYSQYDTANELVDQAVSDLKKVKEEAVKYNARFNDWKNAANTYDTTLAQNDREEIEKLDEDVLQNATPEKVEELIQRLKNIKSLLGSLKKAVDEYKYNGTSVRKIGSYSEFKNKSGIDKNKITYQASELNSYAESSFKFKNSETLGKTGITDNNNPAIGSVNTPAFYDWLMDRFDDFDSDSYDNAKQKKDAEEKKHDADLTDADKGNTTSSNEIKDLSELPSKAYSAAVKEGLVSKDISKVSSEVSGLFDGFSQKVSQAAVNMRDDLYTMSYIMNMFSYDTYEQEAKYHLCNGDVDMSNYQSKYAEVDDQWKNTDVKFSENKTLTNKMINSDNNYSYGNEVEYILYGGSNQKNKSSAYGTIFAIRYVMNLMPEFQHYWVDYVNYSDGIALEAIAQEVQGLSSGIIPAALIKMVAILGLTAAEAACDLQYLKNGMPVELLKTADALIISYDNSVVANQDTTSGKMKFFYGDYLALILFLKLSTSGSNEYSYYARIADVVQANMSQNISRDSGFLAKKAVVYYQGKASVQVKPLMLQLPIASEYNVGISNGSFGRITYNAYRGY